MIEPSNKLTIHFSEIHIRSRHPIGTPCTVVKFNGDLLIGQDVLNRKSGLNKFTKDAPAEDTCKGGDDQRRAPPKPYSPRAPKRVRNSFSVKLGRMNWNALFNVHDEIKDGSREAETQKMQ